MQTIILKNTEVDAFFTKVELMLVFVGYLKLICIFADVKLKYLCYMKKSLIVVTVACSLLFSSCAFFDNLAKNLSSIANLLNCEYTLKNVSNVTVAGVNVKNVTQGNINATDVVKLVSAITAKSVPLGLDVNINVKNPTTTNALLTTMDWALDVATTEFAKGVTDRNYNIIAQQTTTVPLGVSTDLYRLFSNDGINSLKTFASSFNNEGKSSQLGLRIRPSLGVGTQVIKTPNYITIMKPTTSTTTTTTGNNNTNNTGNTGNNGNTSNFGTTSGKGRVTLQH